MFDSIPLLYQTYFKCTPEMLKKYSNDSAKPAPKTSKTTSLCNTSYYALKNANYKQLLIPDINGTSSHKFYFFVTHMYIVCVICYVCISLQIEFVFDTLTIGMIM